MITSTISISELIVFVVFGLPVIVIFIVLIYSFFEFIFEYLFKKQPKVSVKVSKVKEGLTFGEVIKVILFWVILILVVGLLCNKPNNSRYYEPTRF
jgi:hypothetical protein